MSQKQAILDIIKRNPTTGLTARNIQQMIGDSITDATTARRLRELCNEGSIKKVPKKSSKGIEIAAYVLCGEVAKVQHRPLQEPWGQVDKPCGVCGSFYHRNGVCNICSKGV